MSKPTRQFIGRHVSKQRALLACGIDEPAAAVMIDQARAAGRDEIEVQPSAGAEAGHLLVLKRMRGGHADVFRVAESKAKR